MNLKLIIMKRLIYLLVLPMIFILTGCNWIFPENSNEATATKESVVVAEKNNIYGIINDPDGYTNVRENRSVKSDILFSIEENKRFKIISQDSNWWLIEYRGEQGYMYKDRITIIE